MKQIIQGLLEKISRYEFIIRDTKDKYAKIKLIVGNDYIGDLEHMNNKKVSITITTDD